LRRGFFSATGARALFRDLVFARRNVDCMRHEKYFHFHFVEFAIVLDSLSESIGTFGDTLRIRSGAMTAT